jgi:DNA primase
VSRIARVKEALKPEHVELLARQWLPGGKWGQKWYMVRSPFRQENTASFGVSRNPNSLGYYDFGSGEFGDMIDLCCKLHGVSLMEAVEAYEQMLGLQGGD